MSAGTTTSGSSGLPGTARIMPAGHLLEFNTLPEMACATAVLALFPDVTWGVSEFRAVQTASDEQTSH
eukprot:11463930-Heterocapsa_arctica.AAC.1